MANISDTENQAKLKGILWFMTILFNTQLSLYEIT